MSERYIIAGCGFVGEEVARQLLEAGHEVLGLTHSESSAEKLRQRLSFPVDTCDLSEADSVAALAKRVEAPDVIIHCASSGRGGPESYEAVYLRGCQHLQPSFPEATLIFTSSTSVFPQVSGEWVTESSPAEPDRKTGQILRQAEEVVLGQGGIVARLSGIYGPGRSVILQRFLDGSARIEEGESRFLNQIHRDDAASALVWLGSHRAKAQGQAYNVSDGHPMTQRECYEKLAAHFQRPVPEEAPRDLNRKRGWTNKRVSNEALRGLGWEPRFPSFLETLTHDPRFLPSIQALVDPAESS